MGWWGFEPWDNDSAADWAAELAQSTNYDTNIQSVLVDTTSPLPQRQAAAWVFERLGRVYVWNLDSYDAIEAVLANPDTTVSTVGYSPGNHAESDAWLGHVLGPVHTQIRASLDDEDASVEVWRIAIWMTQHLAAPGAWEPAESRQAVTTAAFTRFRDVIAEFGHHDWDRFLDPASIKDPTRAEFQVLAEHPANQWLTLSGSPEAAKAYLAAGLTLDELRSHHHDATISIEGAQTLAGLSQHPLATL